MPIVFVFPNFMQNWKSLKLEDWIDILLIDNLTAIAAMEVSHKKLHLDIEDLNMSR